ncbi:MAG: NAD(P)-binding protein, partial [Deltaproteobacteria bacterium]|nr:NAD(P)-binding protein [Deltaproteobacteria bacterium]
MRRCEMVCVGAGPAGLAAAVEAARNGVDVVVYD